MKKLTVTTKDTQNNPLAKFTLKQLREEIAKRPDERLENLLLDIKSSLLTISSRKDRREAISSLAESAMYAVEDFGGEWRGTPPVTLPRASTDESEDC